MLTGVDIIISSLLFSVVTSLFFLETRQPLHLGAGPALFEFKSYRSQIQLEVFCFITNTSFLEQYKNLYQYQIEGFLS
jgi:hypothetical protein